MHTVSPGNCQPFGTLNINGACQEYQEWNTALTPSVTSGMSKEYMCGTITGKSNHWVYRAAVFPNNWLSVQQGRETYMYAGPCGGGGIQEEECNSLGQEYDWNESTGYCDYVSPIVISLAENNLFNFTSTEKGVRFDLNADGFAEQTAWTRGDLQVGLLALDRNGNGTIDDGRELFGNHTVTAITDGFAALAQLTLESNGGVRRGHVDEDDLIFAKLKIWVDSNHNGVSEASELLPFDRFFSSIGLAYERSKRRHGQDALSVYRGWVLARTAPGKNHPKNGKENEERLREVYDVYFRTAK